MNNPSAQEQGLELEFELIDGTKEAMTNPRLNHVHQPDLKTSRRKWEQKCVNNGFMTGFRTEQEFKRPGLERPRNDSFPKQNLEVEGRGRNWRHTSQSDASKENAQRRSKS